jgi:uncharacterized protein
MRNLILLVIGAAIVTWILRVKARLANANRVRRDSHGRQAEPAVEAMLQCGCCGVHFPASEALTDASGIAFCCEEHLALREIR